MNNVAYKKREPKVLPPRININEFLKVYASLSEMEQAGFRAHVGKEWMRKEEWQKALESYHNR